MVGVDEGDRRGRTGRRRNACRPGGVLEGAVGALVQQRVLLFAEHEQIGAFVVVVVASDGGDERRRQRQRRQAPGGRDVAERSAVVGENAQARPRVDEIEVAVQIEIDERRAVGGPPFTAQRRPGRKLNRGTSARRLGLRRPSTEPLRRSVPVRGSCSRTRCRSRLRAAPGTRDRLLPFLGLAGSCQRDAEVVERRSRIWPRRDRRRSSSRARFHSRFCIASCARFTRAPRSVPSMASTLANSASATSAWFSDLAIRPRM